MFLAENLKISLSASIAFDRSNEKWAKPKHLYIQKEGTNRLKCRKVLSFSDGVQFRVMRLATLTVMSLHGKRYDMIALAI